MQAERIIGIWSALGALQELIGTGQRDAAGVALARAKAHLAALGGAPAKKYTRLLQDIARFHALPCAPEPAPEPEAAAGWTDLAHFVRQPKPGISVVSCCRNRLENLARALPGWLACAEIDEVILVDWGSDQPVQAGLKARGIEDARLKILRFDQAAGWILAQAFNVAFRAAAHEKILKLDADILLDSGFFKAIDLPEGGFVAGNWRLADKDQEFINGVFFIARAALLQAGGFNEFITSYGWDDDDLYARLQAQGLARRDLDPTLVHHLPHDDATRLGTAAGAAPQNAEQAMRASARFRIEANRFLCSLMPRWGARHAMRAFRIRKNARGFYDLAAQGAAGTVPAHIRTDAEYYAALHVLSWDLGDTRLFGQARAAFWDGLRAAPTLADMKGAAGLATPQVQVPRKRLFVDTQHGLGNRLRAMASAAAIAAQDGREMVVVWQPDHHCEGRLSDLFDYEGALIEERFLDRAGAEGMAVYNYMEAEAGAAKDALIGAEPGRDIYARTAYPLNSPLTDWAAENAFLKRLPVTEAVRDLQAGPRAGNMLGLHVRMEGAPGSDHNSYDRVENWTPEGQEKLHYWRSQCHFSRFMARLDVLIAEGAAETVFLAADPATTYEAFQQRYGARIARLARPDYDRSARQIQYALADVLLLADCRRMLGSGWSSFSELALRLSSNFARFEISGKDF